MTRKLIQDALIFWATIDPIGTVAIFAALTAGLDAAERRRTATRAILYATAVLLGAVVVGQLILAGMGVKLVSLQVAGGAILFLFSLKMVFDEPHDPSKARAEPGRDIAVFPLALPCIASPGAIVAAILLTDNYVFPVGVQAATAGVLLLVLAATYALMRAAGPIVRVIGQSGASLLVRVLGLVLAALSVELVMSALGVAPWSAP